MDFGSSASETYSIYRFAGGGKGVSIQTLDQGSLNANSNNIPYSENTQISDCDFTGLYTGIVGTSSIFKSVINNNTFRDSFQGIHLYTDSKVGTNNGPLSVQVTRNIFDTIYKSAIVVGNNPNNLPSNVVSSDNYYTQVGNGLEQPTKGFSDGNMDRAAYPLIEFNSQGNISSNDYFNRAFIASTGTTSTYFFYNTLIKGAANIQDQAAKTVVALNNLQTKIVGFPITNSEQFIEIKYQLTNSFLSRKGTVSINVRGSLDSANAISVSDNYVYTEEQTSYAAATTNLVASPTSSFDYLLVTPVGGAGFSGALALLDLSNKNINGGNSTLYVTGSDSFAGLASFVTGIVAVNSGTFQIITQSSSPQFNYDPILYPDETWTLLSADTPIFGTITNRAKNYISLICDTTGAVNTSSSITYDVTYQTNIFQK